MFKYVADISDLSHYIIKNFIENKEVAIDGTLGNGHDTDFLAANFNTVYSFEIQKEACENYSKNKQENVTIINDSHHKFKDYINSSVDCIVYNLGFLPGGNKAITTLAQTSLESIKIGLELLSSGGIMTIAVYRGHSEGKIEENCILKYVEELPKNKFGVMAHTFINRSKSSPMLLVIEKK